MVTTLPRLTDAEIAHFLTEGYVHQRAVFAPEDVRVLTKDLNRLTVEGGGVVWTGPWKQGEEGHGFAIVKDLATRSALWHDACYDVLRPLATPLLKKQEDVTVFEAVGIIKPPQIGQTFPLHQDGIYYGPIDGDYVIANVYLDDWTPTNGSLQLVPRTHYSLLTHDQRGKKQIPDETFPERVEPQALAGDVVWFHLWTVHGSQPNHSDLPRRTVRAGFTWNTP